MSDNKSTNMAMTPSSSKNSEEKLNNSRDRSSNPKKNKIFLQRYINNLKFTTRNLKAEAVIIKILNKTPK